MLWMVKTVIDMERFDPATDKDLAANYSLELTKTGKPSGKDTVSPGKAKNKEALQKELGLEAAAEGPRCSRDTGPSGPYTGSAWPRRTAHSSSRRCPESPAGS